MHNPTYEVSDMNHPHLTCKACGHNTFAEGKLEGHAAVRPMNSHFSFGSKLILTICKNCGEVASIKVDNFGKF
jgi:ribosomal protein L37E